MRENMLKALREVVHLASRLSLLGLKVISKDGNTTFYGMRDDNSLVFRATVCQDFFGYSGDLGISNLSILASHLKIFEDFENANESVAVGLDYTKSGIPAALHFISDGAEATFRLQRKDSLPPVQAFRGQNPCFSMPFLNEDQVHRISSFARTLSSDGRRVRFLMGSRGFCAVLGDSTSAANSKILISHEGYDVDNKISYSLSDFLLLSDLGAKDAFWRFHDPALLEAQFSLQHALYSIVLTGAKN
jgi:hypothetical protein